jgi:amphi-Trp domain-containing protein
MAKLLEIETERKLGREEAAGLLRDLADSLDRHNEIEFTREGVQYRLKVPDEVNIDVELEVKSTGAELEIELSW